MPRIQVRRDTAANWTSANPVLSSGEIGFETDTGKFKIGNGTSNWVSLAYTSADAGNLDSLTDVVVTSPSNGQILKFNGTSWVNGEDDTGPYSVPYGTILPKAGSNAGYASFSVIGGGIYNFMTAAYSVICGGANNYINGNYTTEALAFVGTFGAILSGVSNSINSVFGIITGGRDNKIETGSLYGVINGGRNNTVNAPYGVITGGFGATADLYGEQANAAGFFNTPGDAQIRKLVLRTKTTSTSPATLALDGALREITIPARTSWAYSVRVVARNQNNLESAVYKFEGCLENSDISALLLGAAAQVVHEDNGNWACDLSIVPAATEEYSAATLVENYSASVGYFTASNIPFGYALSNATTVNVFTPSFYGAGVPVPSWFYSINKEAQTITFNAYNTDTVVVVSRPPLLRIAFTADSADVYAVAHVELVQVSTPPIQTTTYYYDEHSGNYYYTDYYTDYYGY